MKSDIGEFCDKLACHFRSHLYRTVFDDLFTCYSVRLSFRSLVLRMRRVSQSI